MNWRATLCTTTLVLAGCAVGPDYKMPQTPEAQFVVVEEDWFDSQEPVADWWGKLGDPMLAELIDRALRHNKDLEIALANVDAASASLQGERFQLFPIIEADANAERSLASAAAFGSFDPGGEFSFDRTQNNFGFGVGGVWELDLFGRIRRAIEAEEALAGAALADLRGTQIAVAAAVGRAYIALRGAQYQLEVAKRNAENQAQTYDLTLRLFEGGRATELDTSRALAQLESTRASIPTFEANYAIAVHRLGVLIGEPPTSLYPLLDPARPLPAFPEQIKIGTLTGLIRRRPDVAAAERRLAAQVARVGVATANLYPRFEIIGSAGYSALELSGVGDDLSKTFLYGLGISWPFLDLWRVHTLLKIEEAEAEASYALFERTVLEAMEEAQNALVSYVRNRERLARLDAAAMASARAAEIARVRYREGVDNFLQTLDAEQRLLQAEEASAAAQIEAAQALIDLYRALAGDWQPMPATDSEIVSS